MSAVLAPVLDLENKLEDAKKKAYDTLMKQRGEIDEQIARLGLGKRRGRKPKEPGK